MKLPDGLITPICQQCGMLTIEHKWIDGKPYCLECAREKLDKTKDKREKMTP